MDGDKKTVKECARPDKGGRPRKDKEAQESYEIIQAIKAHRGYVEDYQDAEIPVKRNVNKQAEEVSGINHDTIKSRVTKVNKQIKAGTYTPLEPCDARDKLRAKVYYVLSRGDTAPVDFLEY